jgi:predicted Fe-S protein YdhL (DUF1289 family)
MNQRHKTRSSLQGDLFETHDITWSVLSDEQRKQVIQLLSELYLGALSTEPKNNEQKGTSEENHE